MAGANADCPLVEYLADVVRVDALVRERDHATPVGRIGRALDRDVVTVALGERAQRVGRELALVLADAVHTEVVEVVDGGAEPDYLGDRRRPRLELPRDLGRL